MAPTLIGIAVYGNFTIDEVSFALLTVFPNKNIKYHKDLTNNTIEEIGSTDVLLTNVVYCEDSHGIVQDMVMKQQELKIVEESNMKSIKTIKALQKQKKELFDEFVLLRGRYDEQKKNMHQLLWNNCAGLHPELTEIPTIEDGESFVESNQCIGEYVIGNLLGEGHFATVHSCTKTESQKEFAVKMLQKDRIDSFISLARVSNEIYSLKVLSHNDYIVGIHEVIHTKSMLYIVTEKGGFDLFEFFGEHPEGVNEAWGKQIMTCILKGVLFCHEHSICHRG